MPRSPESSVLLLGEGRPGCQLGRGRGGPDESLAMAGPAWGSCPAHDPLHPAAFRPGSGPCGWSSQGPCGWFDSLCARCTAPPPPARLLSGLQLAISPQERGVAAPSPDRPPVTAWLPSLRLSKEFLKRPVRNKKKKKFDYANKEINAI